MLKMQQNTFGGRAPHGPAAEAYRPPSCNEGVHLMGLLQLRYEHDSSTIRLRFGYNTPQHATRFFVRSHTTSYTRISGRRVLHVD